LVTAKVLNIFFCPARLLILSINIQKWHANYEPQMCVPVQMVKFGGGVFFSLLGAVRRPVGVAIERAEPNCMAHLHVQQLTSLAESSLPHNGHTSIFNGHIFICRAIFIRPPHSFLPIFLPCGENNRGEKRTMMKFIYANIAELIYGHGWFNGREMVAA